MHIENIIFDLDGTLIDSAEDVISSLKTAYRSIDPALAVDINASHIGPQLKELISLLTPDLSEDKVVQIIKAFRQDYDHSHYPKTKLRPGIDSLIKGLRDLAIKIFVVTNKPKKATERILHTLQLNIFEAIVNPDSRAGVRLSKSQMVSCLIQQYGLVGDKTVMIGDSESDVYAARENQLLSIIVMDGYGERENILKSQPDFIVNQVIELNDLIKELLHYGSSRRIPQTNI